MSGRPGIRRAVPLFFLLFSGGLLLVCSGASPLYCGHDWTDANTYLTMGRGLLQGAVPYRDLFDHKGPLLYLLYALGALLHPGGFYGVFLLQIFSLAGTLWAMYQTARLYAPEPLPALLAAATLPVFLLSAGVYYLPENLDYGGGSAEEFCLPFFAAALWLSASCWQRGRWSPGALAGVGALAGGVFQIKFSLALFFPGLMVPVFLSWLLCKEGERLASGAGWCALGFGGSLLPYLLYAAATRSLGDFLRAYFWFNASYAQSGAASLLEIGRRALSAAWSTVAATPVLAAALALFVLGLVLLRRSAGGLACLCPLTAFAALGGGIFAGRVMPYTLLPLLLSAFYGLLALSLRLAPALPRRRTAAGLLAALGLAAVLQNQMAGCKAFAWSSVPTCQEQIAAHVRAGPWERPTLLEAGMLSRGFYNQLGLIPEVYYFYVPNVTDEQHPEILQGQLQAIRRRQTDYVVLQSAQPVLSLDSLPEDTRLGRLYRALLPGYRLAAVVPGTGAVDHLYYHLFQRAGP